MTKQEEIENLKEEIKRLQERMKDLKEPELVNKRRLRTIAFCNRGAVENNINNLARYAVDNVGEPIGKRPGTKAKSYTALTRHQREVAREVANKILDVMEDAFMQKPWEDNGEDS